MHTSPYRAIQVAKYFIKRYKDALQRGEDRNLTNLKLQKILYYAQGWYLAFFDKPLFEDDIQAWEYGPVVPNVYHEYKKFKNHPINETPSDEELKNLDNPTKKFLEKVWQAYRGYTGAQLVDFTHLEEPWEEAREIKLGVPLYQISIDSMKKTFKRRVENA